MTDHDAQPGVSYRLIQALLVRDFDALASCLDVQVRFRALLPTGLREASSAADAASCFHDWFGAADRVEMLDSGVEPTAQRVHLTWRLRVHEPGRRRLIEQHAFATVREDRIVTLDLVCSGFQAEEPAPDLQAPPLTGALRVAAVLQGGDANCATLTPLVKAKLGELTSGEVLEVVSSDPGAEADIASWSRLTGNPLLGARAAGARRHFYVSKK